MRRRSTTLTPPHALTTACAATIALTLTSSVAVADDRGKGDTAASAATAEQAGPEAGAAPQVDSGRGYAGHCLDDLGVTVVVDFQDLGPSGGHDGQDIVRCATSGIPRVPFDGTGVQALQAAGFQVEGTTRWGLSFICRLEGRPAADEPLPVAGNPGYTETCVNTPPGSAYWSYWHSADATSWSYSPQGAVSHKPAPGTADGWSFALNAGAVTNPPPDPAPGTPTAQRVFGPDRYATARQIAARYPSGVDTVYVATGLDFPDALAGAALAGHQEAPVLLTRKNSLPADTRAVLTHLQPRSIVVLGGSASVSGAVLTQLAEHTSGTVTRVSGTNRYATAAEISAAYSPGIHTVYLATGSSYPDALSVSALAATQGAPILLTTHGNLPSATRRALERLDPRSIVVVGGEGAVSATVLNQLTDYVGAPGDVSRLSGTDRYATSRLVAERFPATASVAFVATGQAFPDALAGAALAGRFSGPVVLTRSDRLPSAARTALTHLAPKRILTLGGTGAVAGVVYEQLEDLVSAP